MEKKLENEAERLRASKKKVDDLQATSDSLSLVGWLVEEG